MGAKASAWQFLRHIARRFHCMFETFETSQTWPSWDVLLAISCAWAPCTPTLLPCSRSWVNALLIRNAEAKAWRAWITARASASKPLVAGTLIMKESKNANLTFLLCNNYIWALWQCGFTDIQNPLKLSNEIGRQAILDMLTQKQLPVTKNVKKPSQQHHRQPQT